MASLVKKKKGHRLYYYLVESARVDGKPRIVHQAYLGTAATGGEIGRRPQDALPGRSCRSMRLETPLSELTSFEMATFGG